METMRGWIAYLRQICPYDDHTYNLILFYLEQYERTAEVVFVYNIKDKLDVIYAKYAYKPEYYRTFVDTYNALSNILPDVYKV